MAYEDDLMEQYCGFENTEEDFEAEQEDKIRKAEEQLDNKEENDGNTHC